MLGPYIKKTAAENTQSEIVSADTGNMADSLDPEPIDAAPLRTDPLFNRSSANSS